MGIKTRISNASRRNESSMDLSEKLYREERNYRADRLVEKWANVPEIGRGIENMNANTARNLAILLENQTRNLKKMTEAQISSNFYGYTPENMLRLIRLSYPNSIRGRLFTEFAMESMHDSIKYIMPKYTKGTDQGFDAQAHIDDKMDSWEDNEVMYESTESRYATEMVNATPVKEGEEDDNAANFAIEFTTGAFANGRYLDGASEVYIEDANGHKVALAIQTEGGRMNDAGEEPTWMLNTNGVQTAASEWVRINPDPEYAPVKVAEGKYVFNLQTCADAVSWGDADFETFAKKITAVGRYNSEMDLKGEYLGEVELVMKDYHFRPRVISLGVSWTQLTELALDNSFGVSAEEMLMDSAAQEIKKSLDFQAVKYASNVQKMNGLPEVVFDAEAVDGGGIKDSYWQTAQNVQQAIDRVGDVMLNKIMRGGVTAIVGGPAAVNYLKLNKGWSDRGKMPPIGGHQCGELDGVPVFKVPSSIVPDDELLTTWKNDTNESDVSIAIGTLMPFYTTGAIQRKTFYKEAGVARFEDTQALQPKYLGRIRIKNIREIA